MKQINENQAIELLNDYLQKFNNGDHTIRNVMFFFEAKDKRAFNCPFIMEWIEDNNLSLEYIPCPSRLDDKTYIYEEKLVKKYMLNKDILWGVAMNDYKFFEEHLPIIRPILERRKLITYPNNKEIDLSSTKMFLATAFIDDLGNNISLDSIIDCFETYQVIKCHDRKACKINGLKYPASDVLTARTSTLCRSMACTLINREPCSMKQEEIWLKFFPDKKCAYCGKPASHLDHLYPLIIDRKPTGYGTDPGNLAPCCTKCNQSKGNLSFEEFMRSEKCEHIVTDGKDLQTSIEKRINNIKAFQRALPPRTFKVTHELLKEWDDILKSLDESLKSAKKRVLHIKETFLK